MTTLFNTGKVNKPQTAQQPAALGLRVNTSVYGLVIPLVYGRTRIPPNLLWYGDFQAIAHTTTTSSGGGGGGGKGGSSGGSSSTSTSYTYSCAVVFGLCLGGVQSVGRIWRAKVETDLASQGLVLFTGSVPQSPWGYLETYHPDQSVPYPGIAFAAASVFDLGDSDSLPNMGFEITGRKALAVPGRVDADPAQVLEDLLTDSWTGVGFPAARLGDLSVYSAWCRASGLLVSPAYTTQSEARDIVSQLLKFTHAEAVWSEGRLKVVPYGDQAISGNGATYTPPQQPEYDLTDDDFLYTEGEDPVVLVRSRPADAMNVVRLEYLDRDAAYDPAVAPAKNSAAVERYGERCESTEEAHLFADGGAAQTSADLLLKRLGVFNAYRFRLGMEYSRLECMDLVTLTNSKLGLDRQWVRVKEIEEDEEGAFSILAEEYLAGSGAAAVFARQAGSGFKPDYNVDPGSVARLALFEPPLELAGGYELWAAAVGSSGVWGGCEFWVSSDGNTYRRIGSQVGAARVGYVLAATGDTLDVDISGYPGALLSGTANDAATLQTLCRVGQECLAYTTAELIGLGQYRLSGLVRGAYGTPVSQHAVGESFVRLDGAVFRYPLDASLVGRPLYIKACSFNVFQAATRSVADVAPHVYYPTGKPLLDAPDDVANFRIAIQGDAAALTWDPVPGRGRTLHYEIRFTPATENGAWGSAAGLADNVATCSTQVSAMNGTYLIKAVIAAGTASRNAAAVVVTSMTVRGMNYIATVDEAAAGFPGAKNGTAVVNGGLRLASRDKLADWPSLAGVRSLAWGLSGVVESGTYDFVEVFDQGAVCTSRLTANILAYGIDRGNTLAAWARLSDVSRLSGADPAQWSVLLLVATSDDNLVWGEYRPFAMGDYTCRSFRFQALLASVDPSVTPVVTGLAVRIDMPDRVDGDNDVLVPAEGLWVAFDPPFMQTPAISVDAEGMQPGDVVEKTNMSPEGFRVRFKNSSGSGVQRLMDWIAKGCGYRY